MESGKPDPGQHDSNGLSWLSAWPDWAAFRKLGELIDAFYLLIECGEVVEMWKLGPTRNWKCLLLMYAEFLWSIQTAAETNRQKARRVGEGSLLEEDSWGGPDEPACLHLVLKSYLIVKTDRVCSVLWLNLCFARIKLALPVTIGTNDSVLPAPGSGNPTSISQRLLWPPCPSASEGCYEQLVMPMFASVVHTYLPAEPPFGYPLLLSWKGLIFPTPSADLLNAALGETAQVRTKKARFD